MNNFLLSFVAWHICGMTPSASPFLLQASPSYQMRVEAMYIILAIAPLVVLFPWGTISSPSSVSSFFFLKVPLLPSLSTPLTQPKVGCLYLSFRLLNAPNTMIISLFRTFLYFFSFGYLFLFVDNITNQILLKSKAPFSFKFLQGRGWFISQTHDTQKGDP